MKKRLLSVVIPVFNNEQSLEEIVNRFNNLELKNPYLNIKIIFVDDGSSDKSWHKMIELHKKSKKLRVIKFTKNFGQMNAICAGLLSVKQKSIFMVLSADLQDPPELAIKLYKKLIEGADIVFATRISRNDGLLNNFFSNLAWYIIKKISNNNLPLKGSDCFIFSDRAKKELLKNFNKEIFIQSTLINTGFKCSFIGYDRLKRKHGKSGSTFLKKFTYFVNGLYDDNGKIIKYMSLFSFLAFILSMLASISYFTLYFYFELNVPGWTTLVVSLFGLFSINFIFISILGENLWKIHQNTNKQESFVIDYAKDFSK